ncbi:MAG: polysaccharide pyruvyl transferase family protein [Bacteroidetes bacterium]|nr:polysaccharide pyruvyl transferase family protein [Bacteroidota bacterium]
MSLVTRSQIQHLARRFSQILKTPEVAVIGGYHGVNIGDLALGYSVLYALKETQISGGLQTIYNLEKWNWPLAEKAIIGGGAIGYNNLVEVIAKRYKNNPENVAFLGVDFNDQQYSELAVIFLKNVRWISCRSKHQVEKMKSLLGRNDIFFHPDIAFSLSPDSSMLNRSDASSKKLLMNIVPLYAKVEKNTIIPAVQYAAERPELYNNWNQMQQGYHAHVRKIAEHYLSQGYVVEVLPFTPMDEAVARIMLKGLNVRHQPYYPDPYRIYEYIKTADVFFASRYHSTIFGLKANVKLIPFAYAGKNEQLLDDLQIPSAIYHKPIDFLREDPVPKDIQPINSDYSRVIQLQSEASLAIRNCIKAIMHS